MKSYVLYLIVSSMLGGIVSDKPEIIAHPVPYISLERCEGDAPSIADNTKKELEKHYPSTHVVKVSWVCAPRTF